MAEIKIVDSKGEEVKPTVQSDTTPAVVIPEGELLAERVAQLFDIKPSELSKYQGKMDILIKYAKLKTDDHTPDGLKWALRSLENKLGTPPMGEKLINYLHIYAKLYLQGRAIEEQKQHFLRGEKDE